MGQRSSDLSHTNHVSDLKPSDLKQEVPPYQRKLMGVVPDFKSKLGPLRFHRTHGEDIALSPSKEEAIRSGSFCNGIVFSNRPVAVDEKVSIKIVELDSQWKGALRIGFSTHDPKQMSRPLPKFACPDLTVKPGFWAHALLEKYMEKDKQIDYYVSESGNVHYGINGKDKGVLFRGVDTREPLWAMIDLFGKCTSIELVASIKNISNDVNSGKEQYIINGATNMESTDKQGVPLRPLKFHLKCGRHAQVIENDNCKDEDRKVAYRNAEEFSKGYVFLEDQIKVGERIVVQILETDASYSGSLAFGLTSCNPSQLSTHKLPENSDSLIYQQGYWVVSKDVAQSPDVGDELSFRINLDGTVDLSTNGNTSLVFMNANVNMPLWAFWDIYGHTTKIRLIGGTTEPYLPVIHNSLPSTSTDVGYQLQPSNQHQKSNTRNKNIPPELMRASQLRPGSNNTNATSKESETLSTNDKLDRNVEKGIQKDVLSNKEFVSSSEARSDCILCFENAIDCVIYTCGHMCMCYTCATNQWKKGGGFCPLCRTNIHDVIKTFKP